MSFHYAQPCARTFSVPTPCRPSSPSPGHFFPKLGVPSPDCPNPFSKIVARLLEAHPSIYWCQVHFASRMRGSASRLCFSALPCPTEQLGPRRGSGGAWCPSRPQESRCCVTRASGLPSLAVSAGCERGRKSTGRRGCSSPWEGRGVWPRAAFCLDVDLGILRCVGERQGAVVQTTPCWFPRAGEPGLSAAAASSALHSPGLG